MKPVKNKIIKESPKVEKIDLSKCERGDILISSRGAVLEYISPTPWKQHTYLDHVVRYVKDEKGNKIIYDDSYGTRTNEGFTFKKNRDPKIDNDIVLIIKKKEEE